MEYVYIARALVDPRRVTGKARHYRNGRVLPPPQSVSIVQLPESEGYYLLYLDSDGNELNDTWHETVERAMEQAKYEFELFADEWQRCN